MGPTASEESVEGDELTAAETLANGTRVLAVDPRTGIEVFGSVEGSEQTGDVVQVEPVGPGYPPGGFTAEAERVEVVAQPHDDVDAHESRKRTEWDITCMVLSGALENLSDSTLTMLSSSIAEGHL